MSFKISNDNDLLLLITNLTDRINKLEEQNIELTTKIENIQKSNKIVLNHSSKIIIQHLENRQLPSILYNDWIEYSFSLIPSKLETVFENDLLKGVCSVLKDSKDNFESSPICAYNKKKHIFYYYNNEKEEWEILENKKFDEMIDRICYHFLRVFKKCWYDVNLQKINTQEEYKNMYNSYYMKILGGEKMSNEIFHNRIRKNFYESIKENV